MICTLCPRNCAAERTDTHGAGVCAMPSLPVLARAALHMWEEPPISGSRGSGAIFFSGCSLKCVFCQNEQISHENFGKAVTMERLRQICLELIAQGAHNLNFVDPTHYVHVLRQLLEQPFGVPVVYNTGGYDKVDSLRTLEGKVDIYLPDLKYMEPDSARRWSAAPDYPQIACAAIEEMFRQTGPCEFGPDGLLKKGVVIRHLVLPGRLNEAKAVMDWVAARFTPGEVLFSLMSQYTPWGRAKTDPALGLDRPLRPQESKSARSYMAALGLAGFVQETGSARAEYIPAFDLTGV